MTKYSVTLTRSEAEQRYVNLRVAKKVKKYTAKAQNMSNKELEDEIERLNDKNYPNGEGLASFVVEENYSR